MYCSWLLSEVSIVLDARDIHVTVAEKYVKVTGVFLPFNTARASEVPTTVRHFMLLHVLLVHW